MKGSGVPLDLELDYQYPDMFYMHAEQMRHYKLVNFMLRITLR